MALALLVSLLAGPFAHAGQVPAALPGAAPFDAALRARLAAALDAQGEGYVPRTRHRDAAGAPRFSNRLLLETSPYLQQHAHNPVNWYPWGSEAFETARRLGRPVLVSIGYSTCHWCHVMEEESFDDVETAELLNRHFVAIKVDREARPDVDAIYMGAVHAMGQRGGWPLNVWMMPDGAPFYAGTYFPPNDRQGRPGFRAVLTSIREQYAQDPERLARQAGAVADALAQDLGGGGPQASFALDTEPLAATARYYAEGHDPTWGGMRQRIKFPSSLSVPLLLRWHRRSGDPAALEIASRALDRMAEGGIRDHLGGGFHRYSTDPRWLVPHFEKMLYDQALLVMAYLEGWQVTGRDAYAGVAREILDYVARDMTAAEGGFYSATDADSPTPEGESEEGRFFTWTPSEIDAVLGAPLGALARSWYGVTEGGHVEGRSVLHTWESLDAVAKRHALDAVALRQRLEEARRRLLAARAERPPPLRDDKVLAAWNGLMISAFARAGLVLGEARYVESARRAASFVLDGMRDGDRLHRVWLRGTASGPAFLSDYAFLVAGLLDLYEAAPDPRWLREARALQAVLDAHYADEGSGGYYRTRADGEKLIAREKPRRDGAVPSGNSVAARSLLRLAAYTGDASYQERAHMLFGAFRETLVSAPSSAAELLLALDFLLDTEKEILIVKAPGSDAEPLLGVLRRSYVPNRILSVVTQGPELDAHAEIVPLLRFKKARAGRTTAYVCENRVCKLPTSDPAVFAEQLTRLADGESLAQ